MVDVPANLRHGGSRWRAARFSCRRAPSQPSKMTAWPRGTFSPRRASRASWLPRIPGRSFLFVIRCPSVIAACRLRHSGVPRPRRHHRLGPRHRGDGRGNGGVDSSLPGRVDYLRHAQSGGQDHADHEHHIAFKVQNDDTNRCPGHNHGFGPGGTRSLRRSERSGLERGGAGLWLEGRGRGLGPG